MFLFCCGFTLLIWKQALSDGTFLTEPAIIFPFFGFIGLSLIFYPVTKKEWKEKYGDTKQGDIIPVGQKILILVGFLLGILNYEALSGSIDIFKNLY